MKKAIIVAATILIVFILIYFNNYSFVRTFDISGYVFNDDNVTDNLMNGNVKSNKKLSYSSVHTNDALYRVFAEALIKFTNDRMALYGKENLLDQPEFNSDIQKFKEMLQFIDSPTEMKKLIDGEDSLQFHIGKDEEGNGLDDVSFVTKKIDIGGGKGGTITLVGPTRMDYDKISNALEYLAEQLMELYGDDDHRKDPS